MGTQKNGLMGLNVREIVDQRQVNPFLTVPLIVFQFVVLVNYGRSFIPRGMTLGPSIIHIQ